MKIFALILCLVFPFSATAGIIATNVAEIINGVDKYYLYPVYMNKTGMNLLKATSKIDDGVKIWNSNDKLLLSYNGVLIGKSIIPRNQAEWGVAIERVFKKLQKQSDVFAGMKHDKFLQIISDEMLSKLDKYSYYNPTPAPLQFRAKTKQPQIITTTEHYIKSQAKHNKKGGGYLTLEIKNFDENTYTQTKSAVKAYASAHKNFKGIVIDLRNNKGGSLKQAIKTADLFLGNVKIASVKGRNKASIQDYYGDSAQIANGIPIIIRVNSTTASSAELFAASLQENAIAKIVGENSYGKSTVQTGVILSNGSEIVLTWAKFLTPHGNDIGGKGLFIDKAYYSNN